MKKAILFGILFLLIPCVFADSEIMINNPGDDQTILFQTGDLEYSIFTNEIITETESEVITETQNSGGRGSSAIKKYYDVIVDVLKRTYNPGDKITSNIVIDLMPETKIEQDGILTYYLVNPNGDQVGFTNEWFAEGDTTKDISVHLPTNASLGIWQFKTIWDVEGLTPLNSVDSFEVVRKPFWKRCYLHILIPILVGLGIILKIMSRKK